MSHPPVKLLTIAGSDSGGAAGLQADLRTFAALGVYGLSVITAVTAQNSLAVHQVHFLPPSFVAAQMEAVLSDYGATAGKTGFIGRVDLLTTIATKLQQFPLAHLVVDPVLVNHKGQAMFPPELSQAYLRYLFPLATLVTPNRHEAALLLGSQVESVAQMETAAFQLHAAGAPNVLIKGGQEGTNRVDVLFDGRSLTHFSTPHIETANLHGSGDTLSAALCAHLALGNSLPTAIHQAQQFTAVAIQNAATWQLGAGHGPVWAVTTKKGHSIE